MRVSATPVSHLQLTSRIAMLPSRCWSRCTLFRCQRGASKEPHLESRDRFGADVLALLDQGRLLPATDYINAQRVRRRMAGEFRALWSRIDCLLTPTTPIMNKAADNSM